MQIESDKKTILFDLDGTLIDHFTTYTRCYNHAFKQLGLLQREHALLKGRVCDVSIQMIDYVGKDRSEAAVSLFREHFDKIIFEDLQVYDGVHWILQNLHEQGYNSAVFTNKPGHYARDICNYIGIT